MLRTNVASRKAFGLSRFMSFKTALIPGVRDLRGSFLINKFWGGALFNGVRFAEPDFDPSGPAAKAFTEEYTKRFHVDALPFGYFTAEAHDSVMLLAKMIGECGEDSDKVKTCLYKVRNYPGVSGKISFNEKGDGIRAYVVKQIINGKTEKVGS